MHSEGESEQSAASDQRDGVVLQFPTGEGHIGRSALTPRQREIAALISQGRSNAAIAEQLVVTTGTVANHVASILQRLDLDSRTQIARWAVEEGLHAGQDRLLTTLERLLEVQPASLTAAMDHVATLVAEALDAEKVDAFVHDPATATLNAVGTSDTPLGRKQKATGLDRQPIANGGRTVQVFVTGHAHFNANVQDDEEELIGIRRELGVRSQIAVPLEVGQVRRGVLCAVSTQTDYFADRDLLFLRAVSRWVGNMLQRMEVEERNAAASVEHGRQMAAEELVTVLAHDLRNYLAPIRGRLDILRRRAAREGHEANAKDTLELRRSVDRLSRLISDLLDLARIDQGLFELAREPLDLAVLVREAAEGLSVPGTQIEVDVPVELPAVVDPARVRQALENLLANAVQHAPTGTAVRLRLTLDASTGAGPAMVISVADRGPGIDAQVLPHLFDRFARSANSTGLGIGLFVARRIAEAHGGWLEVASSSADGTQFDLVLPAEPVWPSGRPQHRHMSANSFSQDRA
jgi:two-component system OmpR family sensor kinase